jgi:hypothetical protein
MGTPGAQPNSEPAVSNWTRFNTRCPPIRGRCTHALDAGRCSDVKPRAGCPGSGSDIANPAFRFDRRTCFPVPTGSTRPRRAAEEIGLGREERTNQSYLQTPAVPTSA